MVIGQFFFTLIHCYFFGNNFSESYSNQLQFLHIIGMDKIKSWKFQKISTIFELNIELLNLELAEYLTKLTQNRNFRIQLQTANKCKYT